MTNEAPQDTLVAEIEARLDAFIRPERTIIEQLIAHARSLSEANAALEAERDARIPREEYDQKEKYWINHANGIKAQLSAATAEIERLKGALERIADHPDKEHGSMRASIARSTLAASKAEAAEQESKS